MEQVSLSDRDAVEAVDGTHLAQLAVGENVSIQHFHIEPGSRVPEHSHPHEQAGFVYEGVATFIVGDGELIVGPGDSYVIPGDEPHALENRGDDPINGVDIFSPPRGDPDWMD